MHAFWTSLVQSDRSKLFAILLIIKFSPVADYQYFSADLRKPFYKECLIYMHDFDDQWWAILYVFINTDVRKQHHSHQWCCLLLVRYLTTVWVRFSDGFGHFTIFFMNIGTPGNCFRFAVPRLDIRIKKIAYLWQDTRLQFHGAANR